MFRGKDGISDSDFVYYGPWEKQFSQLNLAKDANLELVYKNLSVEIYKINGAFK